MVFSNLKFNCVYAVALLATFAFLSGVNSQQQITPQEIGTDICFCAPNTYEFTLDFSLTCPPVNITLGDAVAATTCMVSPFETPEVADLVPVKVTSIDILELNQNLQVMVQENIEPKEAYLDGETFSYVSYAAIPGEIVKSEDLPRAIQLNIIGSNANGEEIINVYLITFTNSCGAYPVLFEGQWAGWTRFSDLGPPSPELCPIAAPPTDAPSEAPTPPPTTMVMSMSMSMDLGEFESFSIEDLLDGGIEYKSKGKGKGGKKEKSKSKGNKKSFEKLTKPQYGKSKDGKAKDGKGKDGKAKDGKAKDGKAKDGKSEKGGKSGKPNGKDGKAKDGKAKDGQAKDGKAKDGKAKDGSKAGKSDKSDKAKAGAKAGKSDKISTKETNKLTKPGDKESNKLTKPGSKDGKAKDGKAKDGKAKDGKAKDGKAKDGNSDKSKDGAKAGKPDKSKSGKSDKAKDGAKAGKSEKSKDGAKAGKSYKFEGQNQKPIDEEIKDLNKLTKSDKYQGKGKDGKSDKQRLLRLRI
mmetsp:Transcript_17633/g.40658  ORF Transcript_17633/g.40658 Transcript_17633/m.40658 type:complete len:522 (+) Transcript_17633:147-1712(+)|eukprot:CAMPEP_0197174666 /NCGR_PEP_ID=MMETSP1423-20130617/1079_1 /TAXON_ID=476441 /ORGANISM="Pseudo-nitzschia heimii, Strain UNC1101" /LENGTH=521 /DNA_ID=CAMNT_0042623609 /DNA_START=121 /DNA_END=1686 /DNA_ORIENTATION=-